MKYTSSRTTPRWLRVPVLVGLLGLGSYFSICYSAALSSAPPSFVRSHPYFFWFGTWQMFTLRDRRHSRIEARAQMGEQWQDIDLESIFPYRWESGPRYARSSFRKNRTRMQTLAQATCGRLAQREGQLPERVEFVLHQWSKTLGSSEQPKEDLNIRELLDWDCSRTVRLPKGARW